jgi:hypothetical protein
MDHCVKLWSIDDDDNHSVRNVHQTHSARVDALAFSEGKGWLMSGGADGRGTSSLHVSGQDRSADSKADPSIATSFGSYLVVAYDLAAQRSAAWAIPKSPSTPVLHVHLSSTDPNLVLIEIRNNNLQYRFVFSLRRPFLSFIVVSVHPLQLTSNPLPPPGSGT